MIFILNFKLFYVILFILILFLNNVSWICITLYLLYLKKLYQYQFFCSILDNEHFIFL